jgi:PAS domain S-box-containing protein
MYLKGLDGRYAMLNPEMARVLGRPAAEMLGRDPAEVFGPDEVAMIRAFDREVVERGEPTRHEEHLPGLDAYAWSMVIRFPVKDQAGNVTHVGGIDLDITAQKRAQAELESSEQRFRAVVEDQTELICRHGPDLRLTFSNAAHARIFGKRPEDLLGQHMLEDASIPERVRPLLRDELAALTPENPIVRGENEKALLGGEVRWFEWLNRALFDGEGRLTGYQSVGRDGTERRSAEAEITRQREALHQQEKLSALGSLLAGVAHELNNPLAVVIARALMLEEDVRDPALAASVGKLRAAAERCAKIVKTFLALARQKPRERRPVRSTPSSRPRSSCSPTPSGPAASRSRATWRRTCRRSRPTRTSSTRCS